MEPVSGESTEERAQCSCEEHEEYTGTAAEIAGLRRDLRTVISVVIRIDRCLEYLQKYINPDTGSK